MTTSSDQTITTADVVAYEDGKPLDIIGYAAVKPSGPAKGERTAEYIVDHEVPLSDLTEDELDRLVEYRAELKVRDQEYQETIDAMNAAQEEIIAIHENAAGSAKAVLNKLIEQAYNGGVQA